MSTKSDAVPQITFKDKTKTLFSYVVRHLIGSFRFRLFTSLVDFTNARLSYIPLDLMLGFFVAGVLKRFWYLYNIIGFIDNIALMAALYVRGTTEKARQYRRNIVRYSQLTQRILGFMMPHEKENFDEIQYNYNKYFLPFNWAWALIYRARMEGYIESDYYVTILSEEVKKFRTDLAWLCNYDWVPLPMIYPTIVCLAVHTYFLVCVIARQYVEGSTVEGDMIDMVFPFMTSIQFVLYMGWLKVAEALLNPWGEDDDDFETNVLIDRNLAMCLKIVDDGYGRTPELRKDAFWDDEWVPLYSEDSAWEEKHKHHELSLSHMKLVTIIKRILNLSKNSSTPHLHSHREKEPSMRMSTCDGNVNATTKDGGPHVAMWLSGSMLNGQSSGSMHGPSQTSGELSRVMTAESSDALQMFVFDGRDSRDEESAMESSSVTPEPLAAGDVKDGEQRDRKSALKFSYST
ncbi:unnamed protein product [Angiostrongylus costaricensis]|uniref:Bestrophin homolog n=1 Tax=Angiostrongylus costaricensis TaxID=334426 RepID=A0A158PKB2_ANGCS|nr:unnamed protein product [Angiostrongylus costaricensis]